jgi:SAM-dependent methyltransferase
MAHNPSFHKRYQEGITPWETHRVDRALVDHIRQTTRSPCTVLDVGCGTGSNAIWLAQQGFKVTGWDFVEQAIHSAKEKAHKAGANCVFEQLDILHLPPNAPQFDFIFDRGLFHCFKSTNQLSEMVTTVAGLLTKDGCWLSLIGNADTPRQGDGPPQLSAQQICTYVEPLFCIESITASFFDSDQQNPAKNWICKMRKRPQK